MSILPTNNLAKLGIAAAHSMRLELADQLFFPIAVNIRNPSQPMMGGYVGNRSGRSQRLDAAGPGGNTGAFGADFSAFEGDPVAVVKTMTSDGPIMTLQKYDSTGIITVEDPRLGVGGYTGVARYIVKADGIIYDLLSEVGTDTDDLNPTGPGFQGPYRHWEVNVPGGGTGGVYDGTTNTYTPPAINTITQAHYTRPVGAISFRDKQGASAGAIQEQLSRAQSTLDLMSRLLRSLHDESKGPFANIVPR
ncbi:MAG: hypothetical protein ACO1RX_16525 [Candidatus Sericytochromatia bacterium]